MVTIKRQARLAGLLYLLLGLTALLWYWPRAVTIPLAVISLWIGLSLMMRSIRLTRGAAARQADEKQAESVKDPVIN